MGRPCEICDHGSPTAAQLSSRPERISAQSREPSRKSPPGCPGVTTGYFFFASSAANVPPSAASFSISGAIFQRAPYLAS